MQPSQTTLPSLRLAVIGAGRLGRALVAGLRSAGLDVAGPLGRGHDGRDADVVILCVPDSEIAAAAAAVVPGPLIGHCSGASGLDVLGDREGFSLHPLMTFTEAGGCFRGAASAVAGATPRALAVAKGLAAVLEMTPVEVGDEDRAAYHASASIASNFLITLEAAAERLAATAGIERRLLLPLVRATVENWGAAGGERALTGPVARGDEATVARQREAIGERASELLPLFDALADATRSLAGAGIS